MQLVGAALPPHSRALASHHQRTPNAVTLLCMAEKQPKPAKAERPAPSPPQALRLALLDWISHVVVANGALVQTCLQTLVYSLLPPPGPPLPDPYAGEAWRAAEAQATIQDEVVAVTEKVRRRSGWRRRRRWQCSMAQGCCPSCCLGLCGDGEVCMSAAGC